MNKVKAFKWLLWILVSSGLLFGGLAVVLSPDYTRVAKVTAKFCMMFGIIIWGTLIVIFVSKNLNK